MKKFRVGVVGCGGIATWTHLPAYTQLCKEGLAEVVGLCDIKLEKTQPPLEFWPDAYTTADYHDLLKDETIDVIDICTPNYLHSIIAIEAMKAGKHVFCEKPDAITVEEVEMMKKTSEETGKRLMIMRNNRYLKSSQYLKKQIERGEFGDMYCGRCGWQRRRGIPGKGGWFTTKEQSGGGPLIDLGVHMIDLAMYLMGNPRPVSVSGATFCKFADNDASADSANAEFGEKQENGTFDVEDLAMGFIRFENGAVLQVEVSWASTVEEETNFVELRGTKAGFKWEWGKIKVFGEKDGVLINEEPLFGEDDRGHENNLRHYYKVLNGMEEPKFIPQQGVNMIKILRAMYESAATGREVQL